MPPPACAAGDFLSMISFRDPEPAPRPIGALLLSRCDGCGGPAAVRDYYAGPVRCAACWSAVCGTDPMRPIVPPVGARVRYAGGVTPGAPMMHEIGRACRETSAAGPLRPSHRYASSPYRVLIAAREATPSEIPAGARAVLAAASSAGRTCRATYALAEELASGRMVHSCAVRVPSLGYAVWRDGLFAAAWPKVGAEHFAALAAGVPYEAPPARTPPPTGPCPRCGRPVRWKLAPTLEPYKHQRPEGGEAGRGRRVACE
jgi:hypothetical protein